MVKEIVEDYRNGVFILRLSCNCPPLLLPKDPYSFAVLPTYTSPEHPPNTSLPLVLYAIRWKSSDSPIFLVHHCFLWYPGWTQLSSLQRISSHCSSVQSLCSSAHASRSLWFFSEIGGFLLLIPRQYPSFLKAVRTAFSPQLQPSHLGSSLIGISRERELNVAQSIRCLRWGVERSVWRPHRCFWGVGRNERA